MADFTLVFDYENGNLKQVTNDAEKKFSSSGKKSGKNFGLQFASEANKRIGDAVTKTVKNLGLAVAGVGTVTLFKSIGLAREQEDAINRLNGALRASGDFSSEASQELQDFASSLQEVTTIGDEVALNQLALAKSFGASNEQAKEIVSTAADLSAALGIDLESATRNVAKTLGGYAGELGEVLPALKNLTTEQLQAGDAIEVIGKQFQGIAQNELNTFSGALAQTQNSFGDLLEEVGSIISQNPAIIKGLNALTGIFQDLGKEVANFAAGFNIFDDLLIPITNFNEAFLKFVVSPFELLLNVANVVQAGVNASFARIISGIGNLGLGISSVLDTLGIGDSLSSELKAFEETSEQVAQEVGTDFQNALSNIDNFSITEGLTRKNDELREFFVNQRDIIAENTAINNEETDKNLDNLTTKTAEAATATASLFGFLRVEATKAAKDTSQQLQQTANIIKNSVVRGISGSIQQLVNNIAQGKDAFANLGDFILGVFGDLAIQLGEFFIAQGIAVEALKAVSGTGAIVAGAALVALGTLLKNFSGGGSSGAGSASSSGSFSDSPAFVPQQEDPSTAFLDDTGQASTPQTVLNISVEGNVVDQESFTRQLIEDIGNEGSRQGLVFDNFRTT